MKKLLFLTALWSVVITATAQQEAVQAKKQGSSGSVLAGASGRAERFLITFS